jgi:hypothetical protein
MWSNSSTSKTIFIKASLCPVAFIKELEFYFFFSFDAEKLWSVTIQQLEFLVLEV